MDKQELKIRRDKANNNRKWSKLDQRKKLRAARKVNKQVQANKQAKTQAAKYYNRRTKRKGPSNNVRKFRENAASKKARQQNSIKINKLRGNVGKVKRAIGQYRYAQQRYLNTLGDHIQKGVRNAVGQHGPGMVLKGAGKRIPHVAAAMDVFKARPVAKATRDYGDKFKKKKKP